MTTYLEEHWFTSSFVVAKDFGLKYHASNTTHHGHRAINIRQRARRKKGLWCGVCASASLLRQYTATAVTNPWYA
ncbi:hypothetical protein DVH05_025932 [Phytophthora capsici]|nr:hypothetical protein DVH05_025932 [Phytophthora capsici]